jgi:hypothetical protein
MRKYYQSLSMLSLAVGLFALVIMTSAAAAASSDVSGAVTQSYSADSSVLSGMVVELKSKSQVVTPLPNQDVANMLGVVVPADDASVVLTPQSASTQQVLVATSGRYDVLVSNQNGSIKTGDYLAVSALPGIVMKASADQAEIIGRAAAAFNGTGNVISTVSLKNSLGSKATVAITQLPVNVQLAPNPLYQGGNDLPGFLSRAASSITNKQVSSTRVYLSIVVLAATIFVIGSMFYGGVRSGIMAIGRNPLAKKAIGQGLIQTIITGLIIFVIGMFAAYLILV